MIELDKPSNALSKNIQLSESMTTTVRNNEAIRELLPSVPKIALGALLGILVFGLFVIGFDQGQILGIFQGQRAYGDLLMHEFALDMRHAAGFACH
jgi:hypothetical protein